MGVPHLITTLEPHAEHETLRDEDVVIDGPALAYHILHICRANGRHQPSYRLLGLAVIQWLDELQNHRVNIKHIYFDGYLPPSKLPVRMERVVKYNSRLDDFFSAHPKGLPEYPMNQSIESLDFDVFQLTAASASASKHKPFPDPSFMVPAIIDAIRQSPRHRPSLSIVPGEADAYCAKHVAQHGGLVMTSDSDLLVHDLGQGKVVFLRDIHRSAENGLSCMIFDPRSIYRKLGLLESTPPCRFAYERKCSPNATTSQLVKACALSVVDVVDYDEFCWQYLQHESVTLPLSRHNDNDMAMPLDELDPRLSEMLLQLGQFGCNIAHSTGELGAKIFLPILLESPLEGTAWDPSTPIRQLAYTIASWSLRCPSSVLIYEYRRVKQRQQRGRQVDLMSRDLLANSSSRLHLLMSQARKTLTGSMSIHYWTFLCLALNMMECEEQEKHSHALKVLLGHKASSKSRGKLLPSWDLVHFVAHVQAGLYSLRILAQVLSLTTDHDAETLAGGLSSVRHLFLGTGFPSLLEFPDTSDIFRFLEVARQNHVLESLERLTSIETLSESEEAQRMSEPQGQGRTGRQTSGALPAFLGKHTKNNMFGLLDMHYDT